MHDHGINVGQITYSRENARYKLLVPDENVIVFSASFLLVHTVDGNVLPINLSENNWWYCDNGFYYTWLQIVILWLQNDSLIDIEQSTWDDDKQKVSSIHFDMKKLYEKPIILEIFYVWEVLYIS